jgi:S-adenosylmethionine hydrolase
MAIPIITLTTDFGLADHYVGAMKGVILGLCPDARIVDISHDVEPFAISEGAFVIAQAYRAFPENTIHVVVIDPGVGTARRPILVNAAEQIFIAPDNGVLSLVYAEEKHRVRHITNQEWRRQPVSQTFHGRDIFAPAAARIACGEPPEDAGDVIADYVRPPFEKPQRAGENTWTGCVLKVDRFGNVITNFRERDFPGLRDGGFTAAAGSASITSLARTYRERKPGEVFLIAGSSGYLEISAAESSAASAIGARRGDAVNLTLA